MRLLKLSISIVVLALLGYLSFGVKLGEKTLWQHLSAIAATSEARALAAGFEQTIASLWSSGSTKAKTVEGSSNAPRDEAELDPAERDKLRKLIRDKLARSD